MATRNVGGLVNDYAQLRTLPAILTLLFSMTSLYQFGGIAEIHVVWLDYTLSQGHAMLLSVATFAVAFMSSETKQFANYMGAEKVIIVAGFVLVFGQQHIGFISSAISNHQPVAGIVAFLITLIAWGVAVR